MPDRRADAHVRGREGGATGGGGGGALRASADGEGGGRRRRRPSGPPTVAAGAIRVCAPGDGEARRRRSSPSAHGSRSSARGSAAWRARTAAPPVRCHAPPDSARSAPAPRHQRRQPPAPWRRADEQAQVVGDTVAAGRPPESEAAARRVGSTARAVFGLADEASEELSRSGMGWGRRRVAPRLVGVAGVPHGPRVYLQCGESDEPSPGGARPPSRYRTVSSCDGARSRPWRACAAARTGQLRARLADRAVAAAAAAAAAACCAAACCAVAGAAAAGRGGRRRTGALREHRCGRPGGSALAPLPRDGSGANAVPA